MFEFISNSPPETTLLLGLSIGALLSETVQRIIKHKLKQASGTEQ